MSMLEKPDPLNPDWDCTGWTINKEALQYGRALGVISLTAQRENGTWTAKVGRYSSHCWQTPLEAAIDAERMARVLLSADLKSLEG